MSSSSEKKILVIWSTKTHEIALRALCQWFEKCKFSFKTVQISPHSDLSSYKNNLEGADCLIVSSGGILLNQIINWIEEKNLCPTVVSIFPGIVPEKQIEAYITRVRADIVLLNSPKNLQQHKTICKAMNVPFNGRLTGPLWDDLDTDTTPVISDGNWIFAEQDLLPAKDEDTQKLAHDVVTFARKTPSETIYIRKHPRQKDSRLFSLITRQEQTPNIVMMTTDQIDWSNTKGVISLSSALLLAAIRRNRSAIQLRGYGTPQEHLEFYQNSGIDHVIETLDLSTPIRPSTSWIENNLAYPSQQLDAIEPELFKHHKKIPNGNGRAHHLRLLQSLLPNHWHHSIDLNRKVKLGLSIIKNDA